MIDLNWYKAMRKGWPARECGAPLTDEQLTAAHAVALGYDGKGKRAGVEALHIAMAMRDGGCTVRQFQIAGSCGPANNYRRKLVRAKLFTEKVEGKPYAYCLTLTAKGEQARVKGMTIAAAPPAEPKPAKAKKAKAAKPVKAPRKPKAPKVTPEVEPVTVDAPATAPAPEVQPVETVQA